MEWNGTDSGNRTPGNRTRGTLFAQPEVLELGTPARSSGPAATPEGGSFLGMLRRAWPAVALAATLLVLAACSSDMTSTDGLAAPPAPSFQLPAQCAQVHEASTYSNHWPDPDSIDLAQRDSDGSNISLGEPVLASAAGVVSDVYTTGGEHRVFLDHGDGWVTHYIHLESLPPLVEGRIVAQGEQIGRYGNSGTEAVHLHYSQLHDDEAVRAEFDGVKIETHAGNLDSYGTWGTDDAEPIMSLNCAGNTFMAWSQGGYSFVLLYKPGSGQAKIVQLDDQGAGVTTVWEDTWTRGWTHFVPFYAGTGGHPHAILYKSSTGEVQFLRLNLWGEGVTRLASETWYAGWTHFVPFRRAGEPYFLAYDSLHGYANIDLIHPTSDGSSTVYSETWQTGRTAIVPYEMGPNTYLLLYKGGTGEAKITGITGSGDGIGTETAWTGTWSDGWTNIVPIDHEGARYLLAYEANTGQAEILKLQAAGQGAVTVGSMTWTKSWTAFSPFTIYGDAFQADGHLLLYKAGTGQVKTVRLQPGGTGVDTVWNGSWTTGWK